MVEHGPLLLYRFCDRCAAGHPLTAAFWLVDRYGYFKCRDRHREIKREQAKKHGPVRSPEWSARQAENKRRWAERNVEKRRQWFRDNKAYVRAMASGRRRVIRRATPPWADRAAIVNFYAACPPGYHVDHIIPLRGQHVCGLHVLSNLQYLSAKENMSKGNHIDLEALNGRQPA